MIGRDVNLAGLRFFQTFIVSERSSHGTVDGYWVSHRHGLRKQWQPKPGNWQSALSVIAKSCFETMMFEFAPNIKPFLMSPSILKWRGYSERSGGKLRCDFTPTAF